MIWIPSLIFEAKVPRNDPILRGKKPKDAQAVVDRHEDDLLVHGVLRAVLLVAGGPVLEAAAVDPDDDGQILAGGLGPGVDVEEQAIFVAHIFPEKALL